MNCLPQVRKPCGFVFNRGQSEIPSLQKVSIKMSGKKFLDLYEELDDIEEPITQALIGSRITKKRLSKKHETEAKLFLHAQNISREFRFTYKAARFEEAWLLGSLVDIAEHRWISDVVRKAKGGKEASVYLCKPGAAIPDAKYVAVKVYRPRMLRNLKNDQKYREGRVDLDNEGHQIIKDADLHAMEKRSSYGEELRHQSWISYEFAALQTLFEAGADVPHPYALTGNAILMDFIGDELGSAPTLNEVTLDQDEVQPLFNRVFYNVEILLAHGYVHGDLSAYNILYWEGDIKLIDFPQVVSPKGNRSAYSIFSRDVTRLCDYFRQQGLETNPDRLAHDIWTRHGYKPHQDIHPILLDPEDRKDRSLWEGQKTG
jgi:RIO kinase 1